MSCLPFAAWAAKKAAQIVGESGGSGGDKVFALNLVDFGVIPDDNGFPTPGEYTCTQEFTDSIVNAINSKSVVVISLIVGEGDDSVLFNIHPTTTTLLPGGMVSLSYFGNGYVIFGIIIQGTSLSIFPANG